MPRKSRAARPPKDSSRWPNCSTSGGSLSPWARRDNHSTLTAHACPYPNLAEEDESICQMEKMMFSELIGNELELTQCRLNGGGDCRFQTGS